MVRYLIVSYNIYLVALFLAFISTTFIVKNLSFLFIENLKYFIILIMYLPFLLYINKKVSRRDINFIYTFILIFLILSLIKIYFNKSGFEVELIAKLLYVIPFVFFCDFDNRYKSKIKYIIILYLFASIFYSSSQGFFMPGSSRMIFNSEDPNVSGMYILLGLYFARKINSSFLVFIFFILGLMTASRNFMLAIIILYFFYYLKNIRFLNFTNKFNFITLVVIFNVGLLALSYSVEDITYQAGSLTDSSRLININDESNAIRFKINRDVVENLISTPENFLFGLGSDYHSNEEYKIGYMSHSGMLDFLGMYGFLYSTFFIILLYFVFDKYKTFENIEYVYSYAVFSLFLPGLFSGVYLVIFLFLVTYSNKSNQSCEAL